MKTVLLALLIILSACNAQSPNEALSVLVDKTDSMFVLNNLKSQQLLNFLSFNKDKYAGIDISLQTITNFRLNQKYHLNIPSVDSWNANELKRKKIQKSTQSWLDSVLTEIKGQPIGREQSRIFETLCNELNTLSKLQGTTSKTLILISDLGQNSDFCNVYDSLGFDKYIVTPTQFFKLLDRHCPIRFSLKSITVYLVHQATNEESDRRFYLVSNLLKQYIEFKGATVYISANL